MTRRLTRWMHRRGIVRTVNSSSSSDRQDVDQLVQAHRWVPRWLVAWAAGRAFRNTWPGRATHCHLASIKPSPPTAEGTRHWRLHWAPS
ncbi:hypothetical protein [Streptomyces cinereoruber]|uniref:hypothetical protein n=1 Tax=Streptomyces cinereoruber TaxID=67260 RepID=UPI003C2B9DFD